MRKIIFIVFTSFLLFSCKVEEPVLNENLIKTADTNNNTTPNNIQKIDSTFWIITIRNHYNADVLNIIKKIE